MRFPAAVLFLPTILGGKLVIPEIQNAYDSAVVNDVSPVSSSSVSGSEENKIQERAAISTYWYEKISHQGISAFNANGTTYKYFPAGTYVVSSSIVSYYATNTVGNPNNMPVLKATAGFSGFGVIDGAPCQTGGDLPHGATNIFWRQVRNFVIDLTAIPAATEATGIHWPTAQATSLQNIVFKMSSDEGIKHQGVFIESGPGGILNDLVFYDGLYGAVFGSQQFTVRNLTFSDAVTASYQLWDWGWTYKSISVR
ncbi:pectate lyase superfamily protein-domain-containing protein [Daldinia caldariorum]|uniref:pectate lyase superfamily protein-domain-containing protein n=1 Tax=Daldinia caldariorum TaxID=326644 RepID=UPI002008A566|nr:pectate lyase superfamily protein-domain-containing protein [Daldinia caldariorum]KAI1468236.1 pectate lyase superfamily protein-domain-containing protein [Daldinia caldariorum]